MISLSSLRLCFKVSISSFSKTFIDSKMPCFVRPKTLTTEIRDRISLRYNTGIVKENEDYFELVDRIVKESNNNWRTS